MSTTTTDAPTAVSASDDLDLATASDEALASRGLPPRPDPSLHPEAHRIWFDAFTNFTHVDP